MKDKNNKLKDFENNCNQYDLNKENNFNQYFKKENKLFSLHINDLLSKYNLTTNILGNNSSFYINTEINRLQIYVELLKEDLIS